MVLTLPGGSISGKFNARVKKCRKPLLRCYAFHKKENHATEVGQILVCFQHKTNMRDFVGCISFSSPLAVLPLWLCQGIRGGELPLPLGNWGMGVPPGSLEEPDPQGPTTDLGTPSLVKHPTLPLVPAPRTGVWPWLLRAGSLFCPLTLPGLLSCWADPPYLPPWAHGPPGGCISRGHSCLSHAPGSGPLGPPHLCQTLTSRVSPARLMCTGPAHPFALFLAGLSPKQR